MLPEGYKQIEYVESNGTGSYFKTGVLPTANTRVVFDGYVVSGDTALYGSRYAVGNNRYAVQYIGSDQYRLSYDTTESLVPASYAKGTRYTFDQRNNELYINDVLVASVTASPTYPNAREIYAVGALNTNNTASNMGVVRMYSMQIYQNGVLVGDFVPVQDAGGCIGIYNLVTDTLFRNAGSGTVSGGSVLKEMTGIAVTNLPDKVGYQYGEALDLTGMEVTATYDDGSTELVAGYSVGGYDSRTTGEQALTVTLGGFTATFTVNVAEPETYTVTFLDWGGAVLSEQTVISGEAAVAPENPTREGYTFVSWDKDFSRVAENLTVTALYKVNLYTVTFVDWDGTILDTQVVEYMNAAVAPESPTRQGYTFTGWDKDFSSVTSDLTVSALFSTWTFADGVLSIYPAFDMPAYESPPDEEDLYPWKDIRPDVTKAILIDGVASIGSSAFGACTNLNDIVIPGSVARIGMFAFGYCETLIGVIIPEGVTSIGDGAFIACTGLIEVVLPSGLTEMGIGVFMGCTNLTNIVLPEKLTRIMGHTFYGCTSLTSITVPDSVTSITDAAFNGCTNLASITIPEGVTSIGSGAFYMCTSLSSITILRRDVEISDWPDTIPDGATIHGYTGSTAEAYATKYSRDFVRLDVGLTFTVMFLDWDGTVLSEQEVASGSAADPPENPTREGYLFLWWDKDLSNIATDLVVTAIYDPEATLAVSPAELSLYPGQTASISVILLPETLMQKEISWALYESPGRGVVAYDPDTGVVNAIMPGKATLGAVHVSQRVRASCEVTVMADSVESIEIRTPPTKTEYYVGESLDTYGLTVKANYASGKEEAVSEGFTVSGYDGTASGTKTVTVTYSGKSATFDVTVQADVVISVEVTTLPDKLLYHQWETMDLTGIVVTATYASGTITEIKDYTVSGYTPDRSGEQTVTIGYGGLTDSFTVLVKPVVAIKLASPPDKTQYFAGEHLDATGMQINALCEDGTAVDCTSDVDVTFTNDCVMESPAAIAQLGEHTLDIPVEVHMAYVGMPVVEDVVLAYDFKTDVCTVDGIGASAPIHNVLGAKYVGRAREIHISGISEVTSGYCAGFTMLETAVIHAPIKVMPNSMFNGAKKLGNVELPDALETIGSTVFYNSGLHSITLPKNVKTIDGSAFHGCQELSSVALNDGLETIGHTCFQGCGSLKVLRIPDTVTEINTAIHYDLSLDYVKYPAGMPVMTSYHGTDAKTIVIPDGVTEITSGAFSDRKRIEKIFLPGTLKIISNGVFRNCSGLKSLAVPEGTAIVRYGAFEGCGLEEIFFYGRNTVVDSTATIPAGTVIHGYRGSSAEAYCQQFGNTFIPFDDYEFTDEIKNLYDMDSIRKRVVIHFPKGGAKDIENDRIYSESMSLTESICDEENLVFGGCNASKFEIQVADVEEDIRGLEIEVKQYIEEKYVPVFTGVIDSADRQDNRRFKKIIAYDRMYTEGTRDLTSWLKSLTFPMSILDLRYKVCENLGFTQTSTPLVNDYITISKLSIQAGITGREVLRAICEFNGVFGYITHMGYFDYISLEKNGQPFSMTGYRKVKYEEYTVQGIGSLNVRGSNGGTVLSLGGGNCYVLRDNFIVYGLPDKVLQGAAENLLKKIQGIAYRSFSGNGRGLPYILPGRRVQYTVNSGPASSTAEVVDSYVLKRTMTGIQALKDTYSASGDEFRPDFPANMSTSETARQLEDYVRLDDLDMELDTRFEEFTQGDQYQIDIDAAVRKVLQNGGYYKIISVPELPADAAADTIYLIQGEVTVS